MWALGMWWSYIFLPSMLSFLPPPHPRALDFHPLPQSILKESLSCSEPHAGSQPCLLGGHLLGLAVRPFGAGTCLPDTTASHSLPTDLLPTELSFCTGALPCKFGILMLLPS